MWNTLINLTHIDINSAVLKFVQECCTKWLYRSVIFQIEICVDNKPEQSGFSPRKGLYVCFWSELYDTHCFVQRKGSYSFLYKTLPMGLEIWRACSMRRKYKIRKMRKTKYPKTVHKKPCLGYCNKAYSLFQLVKNVEWRSSGELMNYFERVKQVNFRITYSTWITQTLVVK